MAQAVNMPQIGQDIDTGTILEWAVAENDAVRKGDVIVSVQSNKAVFEVEAPASGILLKILKRAGEDAAVFSPIAFIGEPGESIPVTMLSAGPSVPDRGSARQTDRGVATGTVASQNRTVASPAARRHSREAGLDLGNISGSGPGGRIVARDVRPAQAEGDTEVPFSTARRRLAQRLALSKQSIPHFYVFRDVDCTALATHRAELNRQAHDSVTWSDLVVKAAAVALGAYKRLNAHVSDDRIVLKRDVNLGLAVAVDGGLMVPVIAAASGKSLPEISAIVRRAVAEARSGVQKASAPATFTISNLGMHGVDRFIPIINPPECAILGVGSIRKQVVAIGDKIGVRDIMTLCLACDHRAVDGAYAAAFLNALKALLEDPVRL